MDWETGTGRLQGRLGRGTGDRHRTVTGTIRAWNRREDVDREVEVVEQDGRNRKVTSKV